MRKAATESWSALAGSLGLAAAEYRATPLWYKAEAGRAHMVLSLTHPVAPPLILKQVFAEASEGKLIATAETQKAVEAKMGPGDLSVPQVLAIDPERRAVLMQAGPGETADARLAAGAPPADVLHRLGAWLGAFHRATFAQDRAFQPRFMTAHIARLAEEVRRGDRPIAGAKAFLRYAAALPNHAASATGATTRSAQSHGDFNLRNALIDGPAVSVIDFHTARDAPRGFDIGRILIDAAAIYAPDPDPQTVIAPELFAAFCDGYGDDLAQDRSLPFLMRTRLLVDWVAIPKAPLTRSLRQQRRFSGLKRLAAGVLT